MLRGIENIHGELEEHCPFQDGGHLLVQLWWEWDENTGSVEPALVSLPILAFLVPRLGFGPLGQSQSRHEREEDREKEGPDDAGIEGFESLAADISICRGGYGNHVDGWGVLVDA